MHAKPLLGPFLYLPCCPIRGLLGHCFLLLLVASQDRTIFTQNADRLCNLLLVAAEQATTLLSTSRSVIRRPRILPASDTHKTLIQPVVAGMAQSVQESYTVV